MTFDYLKSVLDLDSYDDQGASMVSWTDHDFPRTTITINNCGTPFEMEAGSEYNAAWVGRLVFYTPVVGDHPHALSAALDVVAHEWGHAVSNAAVSGALTYERESGALSEAYSDWLGVAVEQSVEGGAPDWLIGKMRRMKRAVPCKSRKHSKILILIGASSGKPPQMIRMSCVMPFAMIIAVSTPIVALAIRCFTC